MKAIDISENTVAHANVYTHTIDFRSGKSRV
jgi:hypothetical protein